MRPKRQLKTSTSSLHVRHKKDVHKVSGSNILITNSTFCVLHTTNRAGIHSLPLHCRCLWRTRLLMTPWCYHQHSDLISWYKRNTWNLVTTQTRNWYFALSDRNDCTFHTQTEQGTTVSWKQTHEWRLPHIKIRKARQHTTVLQFPCVSLVIALGSNRH